MKSGYRFALFLNLPLVGGACLLALCSCGEKKGGLPASKESGSGSLSPVESYEELLSLRLKDVEQMTDLIASIQDRSRGESVMDELGRLAERQKMYEVNCSRLIALNPNVREESRKEHPAFHAILHEHVSKAHTLMMEGLLRIHDAGYYDSPQIEAELEKCDLKLTDERMAWYLDVRIFPSLKAYLSQYSSMVDMLEGIDNNVAAEAYAMSVSLQSRMVKEQAASIDLMGRTYQKWIPGFERYYHHELAELRKKADQERRRCFRAMLKLVAARMYDSQALKKAIIGLEMDQPRLIDFPELWNDPVITMEEFCLCLERIHFLLKDIGDVETADKRAMEVVDVIARLKRLRHLVVDFQKSGRMNQVKTEDMERISHRAEDAEMAVSSIMAHLIVETDVVPRSPLLSRALGFYRYVMYSH